MPHESIMDLSAERPPTPVAGTMMMQYNGVDKHTTLDSVELLRQRKRELEEQIHQHTEHLRMPVKHPSMLQSQVRVIHHEDDEYSTSSVSSWGDTNVGGTTVGPETTVGGASSSCAQGTSAASTKPKLSSFLKRAEHRVQVSNEVSSVSCSEFGDSYCGEDASMHDSISTFQIPSREVMNFLLQQHSSDDEDDDDEEGNDADWNPNDETDLRHQKRRQERRTSYTSAAPAPKRMIDTSTLGVFVPTINDTEVVHSHGDAHQSVTNASAATTTTQHSCSTSEEDIEMAMRRSSNKNTHVSTSAAPNKKFTIKAQDDHNDPTLGSAMEDDITTITKHDKSARRNKTKCIIATVVIVLLAIIVVALLALIGVMLRNSLPKS